jgi:hypothetical protein
METYLPRAAIRADGPWNVAEGLREGKPIFIRTNTSLTSLIGHPLYPYQAGIAIPFLQPQENGLPNRRELEEIGRIADEIHLALVDRNDALFAVVITTGGMRELVFYTGDAPLLRDRLDAVRATYPHREIQLMVQIDRDWSVYREFVRD